MTRVPLPCLITMELLVDNLSREQAQPASPLPDLASDELASLYQAHSREIYYLTLRLLGDSQRAEDATHDVFLKAFRKYKDFRGDSSCRAWLYRIAINHCSNLRQSWHNRHVFTAQDEVVEHNASPVTDSPLRVLEIKELGGRIQKTLDNLSEEYRLLLLLVADEELSYDEIAALTDQTADAVRGKLHRARKAFTTMFQRDA
ncbi:MAG TPA: RNA polymerase sigma factor [Verrucomicrobiae bacterium]|nr:RNA polymerase sigma factor [Verrucomicrobiae bacterium]